MNGHSAFFSCHNKEFWQQAVNPRHVERRHFVGLVATGNFKRHAAMTGSVGIHQRWFKANLLVLDANPFNFLLKVL